MLPAQRDDDVEVYLRLSGGQKKRGLGWQGGRVHVGLDILEKTKKSFVCAKNRTTLTASVGLLLH